jgi:hypothetical protein
MATITRFDLGQFEQSDMVVSSVRPHPAQRFLLGMEDSLVAVQASPQQAQFTPLDERLQPCGVSFQGDIERRSPDTMFLWHARPVRAPYLAVDVLVGEARQERVVLRITHCESFGLDYAIRGDVMGS